MDAKSCRLGRFLGAGFLCTLILSGSLWAGSARSRNFIVTASDAQFAQVVAQAAERYRKDLAIEWLGKELPPWRQPCPIQVHDGSKLGAGGETSFMFDRGRPFGWEMMVQGSRQRILDSVLPHEITHTIFATHFGRPLPRWADEGACTTVEHSAERNKLERHLLRFLASDRGIAFRKMFAMREYPQDILPLYAQGYSVARFLIQQGGRQRFIKFVGEGMQTNQWEAMVRKYYGYDGLGPLQDSWLTWIRQGRPVIAMPITVATTSTPTGATRPPSATRRISDQQAAGERDRSTNPLRLVPVAPSAPSAVALASFAPGSTGRPIAASTSPTRRLTRPQGLERPEQQVHEWSAR